MLKKRGSLVLFVVILATLLLGSVVYAGATPSVLAGCVTINEVLPDPTGATYITDTDSNGTAQALDEFIELYNLCGTSVDISGWQLWDAGAGNWFSFDGAPGSGTTVLVSGAYAHMMTGVQGGGTLPTMTNSNSIAFNIGRGSAVINDDGDNVVLYDPNNDKYIQLRYNGDTADNPPVDYLAKGFSGAASLVGSVEDWGTDLDGVSLVRSPSGDTNVAQHQSAYGTTASPNAVTLSTLSATGSNSAIFAMPLAAILAIGAGAFTFRRRTVQ